MERHLMKNLEAWKSSRRRKPLILNGARQVGKTWLLKEFGERNYQNVAYINFDNNPEIAAMFNLDYDVTRLVDEIKKHSRNANFPRKHTCHI